MSLKERLRRDLTAAIKARDDIRTATLRMALAAVGTAEVAGATARSLSDDEVVAVLRREAKQRREAGAAFAAGGRPDLADRERAEEAILGEYLPTPLTDEEITALVAEAIAETGAADLKAMGAVMRVVTASVAGRADGARLAAEVRRQLAG